MRTRKQVEEMILKVENCVPAGDRMAALMALEWVLKGDISTSIGLEHWIEGYVEGEIV